MNQQVVSFDMFIPKLKKGHIVPQSRRLIYETEDGLKQIVLPIEMADVLLLASGKYNMRQIIEKMYKRKGSVHFRTIFNSIHQLRDHGFLENGDELAGRSLWSHQKSPLNRIKLDYKLLGRRTLSKPVPLPFYFLSLTIVALAVLSLIEFPSPLFRAETFLVDGSMWGFVWRGFLALSLISSLQALLKVSFQLLLTGNMFGLNMRVSPYAVHLLAVDEPIYLITNRLFVALYHSAVWISPLLVVWVFGHVSYDWHEIMAAIAIGKMTVDVCPYIASDLIVTVRSLLSMGQSDLLTATHRSLPLLGLFRSGSGGGGGNLKKWYLFFRFYSLGWSLFVISQSLRGLRIMGHNFSTEPFFRFTGWLLFAVLTLWTLQKTHQQLQPNWRNTLHRLRLQLKRGLQVWPDKAWTQSDLEPVFSRLPLFSYFSNAVLKKIIEQTQVCRVRSGARIITQGEIGKDLFVLLDGELGVERQNFSEGRRQLMGLKPISIFGEMATIEDAERGADVIALTNSIVAQIPANVIRELAHEQQYEREIAAFRNAITVNQFFSSAPIFKDLPEEVSHNIAMRSSLKRFAAGECIIRQGDPGNSFYMVLRGSVQVVIDGHFIKDIRQGGFFGEIAIIADLPRTATILAGEDCMLMEIAAVNFWEVLCQHIELAMFIEAVGETRLNEDLSVLIKKAA